MNLRGVNTTGAIGDTTRYGAQTLAAQAQKRSQQVSRQAQSGLQKVQVGITVGSALLQSFLHSQERKARKNLTQVSSNARGAWKTIQKRYRHAQRKRARARALFRWGLVVGFVLALLYTPITGAEARHRVILFWEKCKEYFVHD